MFRLDGTELPKEVILVEKTYDEKIDMWGLGCVFAEMILCCKEFNTSEDGFDP